MSFEPVFLDEPLNSAASMTFLRHTNNCPRSGFLYRKHRNAGVQTVAMLRGSAAHAFHERATKATLEERELSIPPELAKAVLAEVLEEYPVPVEEHDYLREYAHRWASEFLLRADEKVIAVERMFVLELDGWTIRGKVDFASADELKRLYVADYKSGRGAPTYDSVSRRRPDGTLAAKAFQLIVYVLLIVFGRPLCMECLGMTSPEGGYHPVGGRRLLAPGLCPSCGGDALGEQLVRGCEEAIVEYVFPGVEDGEGRMLRRTVGLTRLEMLEYRESLQILLRQVAAREESGDWPAVVSDQACDECPCSAECPIPAELRDHHGSIDTVEQAREALARRYVSQARDRAIGRELRAFMENVLGGAPIRYGRRVAEIVPRESVEVKDKAGLYEAIAGGMPVAEARAKFEKPSKGTSFAERDLQPDEFTPEKEADDGGK